MAGDRPVDIGRRCGHEAAQRKHDEAENDDLLAPDTVGRQAEGNHQNRLGQAVHAERQADQGMVVAARQMFGIQREHRQDQEHAQHAQAENGCQPRCSASFIAGHAFGQVDVGHGGIRRSLEVRYISRLRITPAPPWTASESAAHARTT
jgi:hypothetical protein